MLTREFFCTARGCEFMVRSDREDELIRIVQEHADHAHGRGLSSADIRGTWTMP